MEDEEEGGLCCISHAFWRAASVNPNKVAIIHSNFSFKLSAAHGNEESAVYGGDVVYTYGELQSAVNDMATRIANIFLGAHDPHLIPPRCLSLEVDKCILANRISSIGHMEDERTCDQNDAVYEHIRNSFNLSDHNIDEPVVKHVGHSSSPNMVGIYIGPSAEYVITVLAVLRSGGAFLPIDPAWPKERVLAIVSASKVHLIISCEHASSLIVHENHEQEWLLEGCKCPILCLTYGCFKGSVGKGNSDFHMSWPCQSQEQRLYCYVMYTSGSTGKPNGVCGTEKGITFPHPGTPYRASLIGLL